MFPWLLLRSIFFDIIVSMKSWIITVVIVAGAAVAAYLLLPSKAVQDSSDNDSQSTRTETSNYSENYMVTLKTSKGDIELELHGKDAPKTVENFIKLSESGYYNGVIFHRVIADFMIQGGDPTGTGTGGQSAFEDGAPFADELNPDSESYQRGYARGTLAMANRGPNTNTSQFFIVHKDSDLPHLYTIFGRVTDGMDVVDEIATAPVNGEVPVDPVKIESVEVE